MSRARIAYLRTEYFLDDEEGDVVASWTNSFVDEEDVDGCNNLSSNIDFRVDLYMREENMMKE